MGRTQTKTTESRRVRTTSRSQGQVRTYVDGNTVRKLQEVPARKAERKSSVSTATRQRRERALQMNLSYVVFLAVAAVVTVMVCINYLQLQSRNTTYQKTVTSLNTQLSELKLENDSQYNRIISSVDLEHVKDVAMNELGMTYPTEDQVYTYDATENDYVKQYQDVPAE